MNSLEDFQKESQEFINTLVLDYFKVVRLVGVVEIEEEYGEECYWKYDTGKEIVLSSCLIVFIPLKNKLSQLEYTLLKTTWNLNNENKVE